MFASSAGYFRLALTCSRVLGSVYILPDPGRPSRATGPRKGVMQPGLNWINPPEPRVLPEIYKSSWVSCACIRRIHMHVVLVLLMRLSI